MAYKKPTLPLPQTPPPTFSSVPPKTPQPQQQPFGAPPMPPPGGQPFGGPVTQEATGGGAQQQVAPEPGGGTPQNPPNPGGQNPTGGPGNCPPGEVWRDDSPGHHGTGQPGCEPEDWRSKNGQDTCVGPPPEGCIGECTWCDFKDAQLKCDNNCNTLGGYGNSGGHGHGGGGGGAKPPSNMDPGLLQSEYLWNIIMDRLKGPSRYSPEVMSSLLGGVKSGAETQAAQQTEASNADMASRGIARSGVAAAAQRDIRAGVSNQVLGGRNAIFKAKIDADYQDKTQAIKEAQDWLNSLRDFVARMAATKAQKDAAMANIALGYARLEQELKMMREGYAQQLNYWQITNGGGIPPSGGF